MPQNKKNEKICLVYILGYGIIIVFEQYSGE